MARSEAQKRADAKYKASIGERTWGSRFPKAEADKYDELITRAGVSKAYVIRLGIQALEQELDKKEK